MEELCWFLLPFQDHLCEAGPAHCSPGSAAVQANGVKVENLSAKDQADHRGSCILRLASFFFCCHSSDNIKMNFVGHLEKVEPGV